MELAFPLLGNGRYAPTALAHVGLTGIVPGIVHLGVIAALFGFAAWPARSRRALFQALGVAVLAAGILGLYAQFPATANARELDRIFRAIDVAVRPP
jgi:uncharacterized membrane protein HdeD (DUF308 family)